MPKGIFVTGTDTGVGKTLVSAGVLQILRSNGQNAGYFKPVQSGAPVREGKLLPEDALFVTQAVGLSIDPAELTAYLFQNPVSPHYASRLENNPVRMKTIISHYRRLQTKYSFLIVEGCGGLAVPLNESNWMVSDMVQCLGLSLLIVARAGLGTINHTLLTIDYAKTRGIEVKGIIINQYSGSALEDDNVKTIQDISHIPVLGKIPVIPDMDSNKGLVFDIFPDRLAPSFLDYLLKKGRSK